MMWPSLIFLASYVGVALGRIPGLTLDRTGIALLGAIAMIEVGTMSFSQAVDAVDLPTVLLLYALMVVSAQLKLSGFYTHIARLVSAFLIRPRFFLFICMLTSAVFSAILANDIICLVFRHDFDQRLEIRDVDSIVQKFPRFVPRQSAKGLVVVGLLLICFLTQIPRESSAIAAAGVLLCSRKMKSRQILESVDWHLITLFCGLFIIVRGIEVAGLPTLLMGSLKTAHVDPHNLYVLCGLSAITSNLFSNVPAAMLLVKFLDPGRLDQWYALAVSSTFAGNLITIGSIANLIVIEQAASCGVRISFWDHARVGIPVTLASFVVLAVWIWV